MILWLVVQIFIWQNYAKTTKTMNGDECDQFPQQYNGVQYSNCFQVAGKNLCYTTNGQLEECVPLRTTLPGNTCAIHETPSSTVSRGNLHRCVIRSLNPCMFATLTKDGV
eukprot:TRINITY_DN18177_c0_g1_i4.p3 TRINITY_DN18177_c0_g1~~TRINITY_DN18177_c0_g1_i4.p3  ORF type:complete len:110 (+),score=9.14 TRINITY_DN18177_c0_g1_i4:130-459(+)